MLALWHYPDRERAHNKVSFCGVPHSVKQHSRLTWSICLQSEVCLNDPSLIVSSVHDSSALVICFLGRNACLLHHLRCNTLYVLPNMSS